jgi:cell shape-determining protein MreD
MGAPGHVVNGHLRPVVYGFVATVLFAMLSWTVYGVHTISLKVTALETAMYYKGAEIERRLQSIETTLNGKR